MKRWPTQQPAARKWTSADLPLNLREFTAAEWGCDVEHLHLYQRCAAYHAWRRAGQQWLDDHGVSRLQELRDELAARRKLQGSRAPDGGAA